MAKDYVSSVPKFLLLLILLILCRNAADSASIIKHLPGFDGPLPFELETGCILVLVKKSKCSCSTTSSSLRGIYLLIISITLCLLALLEIKWSGISLEEWWRNEQFWLIGGTSAHLAAVIQGLLKVVAGIEISFTLTSKSNRRIFNVSMMNRVLQ